MRSVLAGLVAVATVGCTTGTDPSPIASRSTVANTDAATPGTDSVTSPTVARSEATDPTNDPTNDPPTDTTTDATDDTTDDATDDTTTTLDPAIVLPEDFERVAARVIEPDGTVCDLCLWLADDADGRARGLMFVTDLGPADGMAFVYPDARTTSFWMKNTLLPLSIAFYDADGAFLSAFDMEPCQTDACPRYRTAPDFLVAVETTQGDLPAIGMVPGSELELLDRPCE